MRYHRVTVRNFRGVSEATVAFPEGRLLVIEGPNEAGKSSIVEAIGLLFDYPAESTAEEVRRVRPAGRDADPEVELEFTTGGSWCRYRKVFGRRGTTELEVRGSQSRRLAGREAHDEAKRLLRETTDEALMRALRVLQGESLAPPDGLDGSAALQRALDVGAADVTGENLFERARRECLRYYTERAWRETGELREARDMKRDAKERVEHLKARLANVEQLARRVMELEPQAAALREELAVLRGRRVELEAQRVKRQEALQVAALARKKVEAARERQRRLEEAVERRATAKRKTDDLEAELTKTEAALETRSREALGAMERANAARQRANAAHAEAERLDRDALLAEQDYSHLQEELQLQQMVERLRRLDEAEQRGADARAFLDRCRIGPDQLAEVETAEAELRKTEAQLRMAAAQVEVEGPAGATIFVDGTATALTEKPLKFEAEEERQIELPGGFVVVVRPSVSQGKLEERLAQRRESLEGLLRKVGATTLEEARELERRRQEAERDIAMAEREAKAALRDLRDRVDLA
ncbi:AAA family ATPase, partial [Tepidiforma sp.]|uniref:AAA family ATPase n=1 Tax=Tepidiforma sp. TaxID=2682230 RepID=UPI002ADE8AF6